MAAVGTLEVNTHTHIHKHTAAAAAAVVDSPDIIKTTRHSGTCRRVVVLEEENLR